MYRRQIDAARDLAEDLRIATVARTSCPASRAASATPNASLHVSITTRLGGRLAKYPGNAAVRHLRSSTICPSLRRTQI
jgi:hypothetical protein